MASVSGSATDAILKIGSTFGTATTGTTGDKLAFASLTHSLNETVLQADQLGAGIVMTKDATKGNTSPTAEIDMYVGPRNLADLICFAFMQTAPAPAEETASQGDYRHRLTYTHTISYWLTLAFDSDASNVVEYPSCTVRRLTLSVDTVPGYVKLVAELLGNKRVITSTTNDTSELLAATVPTDTELFAVGFDDDFQVNAQSGGALSTSDQVNITSYTLTLERPQEFVGEIKNATGNSEAISTGFLRGTLTVTLKEKADNTWYTANDAETAYKCKLIVEGSPIASGGNRALRVFIPRMKLIQSPEYNITDPGINPMTLTFELFAAESAPTGMDSVYPYFEFVNTRTTGLSS